MNVLLLSVSTGGGHLRAAEAIREALKDRFPGAKVQVVDILKHINPIADGLIVGGYINILKSFPGIYGKLYNLSESSSSIRRICSGIISFLSSKALKLIEEFAPSVIVCTHIFPLEMLSILKSKGKFNIPVIAIITDYAGHSFWVRDNVDAYVVPHNQVKKDMIMRGIPEDTVYPYGIPVLKCFLSEKNPQILRSELGLENKPTVLIMGGSLGFGNLDSVFKSLLGSDRDLQIIAVTGHNLKLKKKLDTYAINANKKVRIFSYTDRISELMDISDIIITKPGGMTTAESLVKGLPIFVISPVPGQEERNARFLINNGAGVKISDISHISSFINQVLDNPARLEQMKEMSRQLARPNSCSDIVNLMEKLICK